MTDEEKAEEHTKENYCKKCHLKDCSRNKEVSCYVMHYNDFLDGLAEGKKEQEKKDKGFCETVCMKGGKIAELEKENEELKDGDVARFEIWNKRLEFLEKENTELKQQAESDQLALNESKEIIAELKAQIEKMKCCKEDIINSIKSENADIEWVKAHNGVAKFIYVQKVIDIINDKWELAE